MTLREKLKWNGDITFHKQAVGKFQLEIACGKAQQVTYYWFVGETVDYAVETYLHGDVLASKSAAKLVVKAALQYFYGEWRFLLKTQSGESGHEVWRLVCLWYDEVHQSLPFAGALSDWESMKRIAEYPPEDKLPAVDKARGETAWSWAIINFLRGESAEKVERFLKKAEDDKAKRPKLLCPVLRAM